MYLMLGIYKEKKKKDFRMVILPTCLNKIGLITVKEYGIVSYLSEKDTRKIGELILFGFCQCDENTIEEVANIKYEKKFFVNTTKLYEKYNLINLIYFKGLYSLEMSQKEGYAYSTFKDKNGNEYTYTFKKLPTSKELGEKVMEMFKYKENYDNKIN